MTNIRNIHHKIRRHATRLRRCAARGRADESGLTTLEWLLIVAAVAGLAALAVVLVTNVVDDTSEQISGSSARVTAARVAAQAIVDDAARDAADQPTGARTYGEWIQHYTSKCDRLEITYGDAGIETVSSFVTGNKTKTGVDRLDNSAEVDGDLVLKNGYTDGNSNDEYDDGEEHGELAIDQGNAGAACFIVQS